MKKENVFKSPQSERFILSIKALIDAGKANSFSEIAKSTGYNSQDFTDIKSGKKDVQRKFLDSVVDKYGIDKNFILTGERNNVINSPNRGDKPQPNAVAIGEIQDFEGESPFIDIGNGQYLMVIPVVPIKAQAGYIQHYNDEKFIADNFTQKHSFAVSRVYRGKYIAFIVDGDSMDNGIAGEAIPEGYTVTGREIQRHLWRNKFHIHRYKDYVIVHRDGIYIKQIIKHDTEKGIITCHSLNPDKEYYADFDLNLDECLQIFNVVNVTQTK